jgi:hypothetical protein
VPRAASRYIAAHDEDRCHRASPPPFQGTGARLIFVVPPEGSAAFPNIPCRV